MRVLPKRLTLRGMMLAIALIAIVMGLIVGIRAKRLRTAYLRSVGMFAALEESERDMEKLYSEQADWYEKHAGDRARFAASQYRELRRFGRMTYAIPMPGSSGDRPEALMELMQMSVEQSIDSAMRAKESATEHRGQAELAARRATHFSRLKQKYERAVAHPWLAVAPDPPAPQ
jgi:hypothetical protein